MISMKLRNYNLKLHPAGVVYGRGLSWLITGIFDGDSDQDTGAGVSRNIRQ
jgi:hypothetical protein